MSAPPLASSVRRLVVLLLTVSVAPTQSFVAPAGYVTPTQSFVAPGFRSAFPQLMADVGAASTAFYTSEVRRDSYDSMPSVLAAKMAAEGGGGGGGDCLKQAAPGAATLENPEPDFFILGMKSYGRNSAFLMRVGYEQVGLLAEKLGAAA